MENFWPYLFLFFVFTLWVWCRRARRAWKALTVIPQVRPQPWGRESAELVTVLIPVRNEEKNIAKCLSCLQKQDYPNFQVLIINDRSTDRTEAILKEMEIPCLDENSSASEAKFAYLNCRETSEEWTGKNYALNYGIPKAQGTWYLFTDADTVHEPSCLSSAMREVQTKQLRFLTLLPRCLAFGFFENLLQPVAMLFIGLWFPMEKANDPKSPVVFGNGQFLLISRETYESIGGHEAVKAEFLEDYALMRNTKESGRRLECALGTEIYGTRMYSSLSASWRGWRRIFLHSFRQNPRTLLRAAGSAFSFSAAPFILLFPMIAGTAAPISSFLSLSLSAVISGIIMVVCWKGFKLIKANQRYVFLHPLAAFFITGILLNAFWIALRGKKTKWR